MIKYLIFLILFAGACSNGKIAVNDLKGTQDKSNKESIFKNFLVAMRDNDFEKLKPMMVQENEYVDYLKSLTTETVPLDKLGGSVSDLYKFHLSQTERSFKRVKQRSKSSNIDWTKAEISDVTWEKNAGGQGQNARFTVRNEAGEKFSILAKGMSQVNGSWRIGNTFLFDEK